MAVESHRARPVLDNARDIQYALEQLSRVTDDRTHMCRSLVEHFAVDLDLLAFAMRRTAAAKNAPA
ncbi:hypothetical protein [Prosthecomicrobium hirschii]|jgi:hypothetical protein|uniref:Uncharacterized protein n=1 Tax=Prosthecodimorpha hirschii TaxID=665126 RepID=A0A0N8GF83_9HYPH|nr:hypothetical protein [Prosthecomicrobium hirschii]KPL53601.1 hypothetical protein ABB55_16415 [Prosthecomicrobium hirschii]MCW1842702.1 hypothetical protein [Prosthecomicrobium hirschii]TPQ49973.1 hypothetical protein C2U72_15730 [Prosthecomicrobium hirschii]